MNKEFIFLFLKNLNAALKILGKSPSMLGVMCISLLGLMLGYYYTVNAFLLLIFLQILISVFKITKKGNVLL